MIMPLNERNTKHFHRTLYAGQLETVTILKRDDDQRQGTITALRVFNCRRGQIRKTGEPIQGDMSSDHTVTWHIPRAELDKAGITHINGADVIVDRKGRRWTPLAPTTIEVKLFENHLCIDCQRIK